MWKYCSVLILVSSVCVFSEDCDGPYVYECTTGECFPAYVKCDNHSTCPGGEDEENCGPRCYQCENEWHTSERGCIESWSGSKYGAPQCAEHDVCINAVKSKNNILKFFMDCMDKETCSTLESKNPPECYETPVKVNKKCTFCCETDYCNKDISHDVIIG